MKKLRITALLLACGLMLSGCSLVSVDEDAVRHQVIATVNGAKIYRYEAEEIADMYASYYGIDKESNDEEMQQNYEMLLNDTLDNLVTNEVMFQKASDLGISLTEEEKQQNRKDAEDMFQSIRDNYQAQVEEEAEADPSIDVEAETEKRFQEHLKASDNTLESYTEDLNKQALVTKVQDYVDGLAEVSDDEVEQWYNETLEIQKDEFQSDPEAFETTVGEKNIYTYVPEDTVAVKQVLLKYEDTDLSTEAENLYENGDVDGAMALVQPEADKLMTQAEDVVKRLRDGEEIDALIEELGEDENMMYEPYSVSGYLVNTQTVKYGEEFRDAALELFNIGDVSEPVILYDGLHILQSIEVYNAGVIPFDEIKEDIKSALLTNKQMDLLTEKTAQWEDEADIVYHRDRLKQYS